MVLSVDYVAACAHPTHDRDAGSSDDVVDRAVALASTVASKSRAVIAEHKRLMFAAAARRMDFSTLGFCQYLSPSLTLLVGIFVFHEPMRPAQMAAFAVIWGAVALFVWDALAVRRASA